VLTELGPRSGILMQEPTAPRRPRRESISMTITITIYSTMEDATRESVLVTLHISEFLMVLPQDDENETRLVLP